jgi:hypothetical protein
LAQVLFGQTTDNNKRPILVDDDGVIQTSGSSGSGGGGGSTVAGTTTTDRSGTIVLADGTATIAAAAGRLYGHVQNTNATGTLKVKEGGTASSTVGWRLEPGETYLIRGTGAVTLWAELAASTYEAIEVTA